MSYNIYITNLSYHDQEFEMNGFNENQNIIVSAGRTSVINTAEGSTGAIIALHNGVRCEQAEINRDGADGK